MYLSELLDGLEYAISGAYADDIEISTPVTDSRDCVKDSLFICLDGTRFSGDSFAVSARELGAAACVCSRPIECGMLCVTVSDTRLAAAVIWNNYYRRPARDMRVYGITGTNGKTSTAAFLKSILEADGRNVGIIGTLGSSAMGMDISSRGAELSDIPASMTTPDPKYLYGTLRTMRDMGVGDVVMEVSSHSLLQKKVAPIDFEVGIFTNLSPEHLDCHKDMETYFKVKSTMFDKCRKTVTNGDDPYGRRLCGTYAGLDMTESTEVSRGCSYLLKYKDMKIPVKTQVSGDFTVYNTMLAAIAALETGASAEAVRIGIENVKSICGRMEHAVEHKNFGFDVYIDYAHTPRAMEAALSCFSKRKGRLVALFGCGGDRDREKRPLMGKIASRLADKVIVTSDNPRSEEKNAIIRDIISGIPMRDMEKCTVITSRKDAIFYAVKEAIEGDVIVLLGKGHETWETGKSEKIHFDEREILKEALKEYKTND